jgi:hypothetical protein
VASTKLRHSKRGRKSIVREDNGRGANDLQDNSVTDFAHRSVGLSRFLAAKGERAMDNAAFMLACPGGDR